MFSKSFVLTVLAIASAAEEMKNTKRSIGSFGYPSWNSILGNPWSFHNPYHATSNLQAQGGNWRVGVSGAQGSLHPLSYSGKLGHFSISSSHDVASAVAAAKEAAAAAALAHQKVQAAREQVVIQERVAAAKEAAAHAAIQRSEAAAQIAAAVQKSEALAAAAAAVQKSAAASAVSAHAAAHAAGSFTSPPWLHSKSSFNHWG